MSHDSESESGRYGSFEGASLLATVEFSLVASESKTMTAIFLYLVCHVSGCGLHHHRNITALQERCKYTESFQSAQPTVVSSAAWKHENDAFGVDFAIALVFVQYVNAKCCGCLIYLIHITLRTYTVFSKSLFVSGSRI